MKRIEQPKLTRPLLTLWITVTAGMIAYELYLQPSEWQHVVRRAIVAFAILLIISAGSSLIQRLE